MVSSERSLEEMNNELRLINLNLSRIRVELEGIKQALWK